MQNPGRLFDGMQEDPIVLELVHVSRVVLGNMYRAVGVCSVVSSSPCIMLSIFVRKFYMGPA